MKILVVDDNPIHLDAAKVQLKDHEVTVVNKYWDAEKLFGEKYDQARVEKILAEQGIVNRFPSGYDPVYSKARRAAEQQSVVPFEFDAVLVDLLMPAEGSEHMPHAGEEMPIGIFLALLAAKADAKYVAVFTDQNHHNHPASACLDAFNFDESSPTPFVVEGAKVLLCNNRNWVGHFRPENLSEEMSYQEYERNPSVKAKNWKKVLDYLIS